LEGQALHWVAVASGLEGKYREALPHLEGAQKLLAAELDMAPREPWRGELSCPGTSRRKQFLSYTCTMGRLRWTSISG